MTKPYAARKIERIDKFAITFNGTFIEGPSFYFRGDAKRAAYYANAAYAQGLADKRINTNEA